MGPMGRMLCVLAVSLTACAGHSEGFVPYSRAAYRHWIDLDRDCQDARQEALIAASEAELAYKTERQCKVVTGQWTDPYTGKVVTKASDLDVDHIVPLREAHESGGFAWTAEQRRAFANDPYNLLPVTASANRSKGSKGPGDWLPVVSAYRCGYIERYLDIKRRFQLSSDAREAALTAYMTKICDSGQVPPQPQ